MSAANDIPALEPPPGLQSNFNNPTSLYPSVVGVAITTVILMTIAVSIRIYTKAVLLKNIGYDDYLSVVALVGFIVSDSLLVHVSRGLAHHQWDIRAVDMPYLLRLCNAIEIAYSPAMFAAKLSILIQLKRLFCPGQVKGSVFRIIYTLIAVTTAYYISCLLTFIFQCWPREAIWNPAIEGRCISSEVATLVPGIINFLLDVGMVITPIWVIWHLQLPTKRKLGVSAVFGVCFFTCAIAALGIVYRVFLVTDPDKTWSMTRIAPWAMAEYFGTIFVGCMPSFPRFFRFLRGYDSASRGSNPTAAATAVSGGRSITRFTPHVFVGTTKSDAPFPVGQYIELEDGMQRPEERMK